MSNWLVCSHLRQDPKLRLLCFPHAGGSAWFFRDWADLLPTAVEVYGIELPGRGKRILETPLTDISSLIQVLGAELFPLLDVPLAFFGHSLGARIAFELCRWLRRKVQHIPVHFWAAAARAPHLPPDTPPIHALPNPGFIIELKRYNGTPESVLNNPELMNLMLPTIKADFSLLETYKYQSEARLACPITCFWGQQDEIANQVDVAAWRGHTSEFTLKAVPGDHFFIQQPLFPKRLLPKLTELLGGELI